MGRNVRERLRIGRHKRGRSGAKRREERRSRGGSGGGGWERVLGLRGGVEGRRERRRVTFDAMSSLFRERCSICKMEKGVRGHQAMCRPKITPRCCPGCRWVSWYIHASVTPTCFNISLGSLSLFTLFTFQEALLATVLGPPLSHDVGMRRKINRLDRAYFD